MAQLENDTDNDFASKRYVIVVIFLVQSARGVDFMGLRDRGLLA